MICSQTVSPVVQEPLALPGRCLAAQAIPYGTTPESPLHPWLTANWGHGRGELGDNDKNGHNPIVWRWLMQSRFPMISTLWSFQNFQGPRSTAGGNKVSPCILPALASQLVWLCRGWDVSTWDCTLPACCTAAQHLHLSSATQDFVPGKFSTRMKPRGHWYTNIPGEYSRSVISVSSHCLELHQGPHRTSQLWSYCTHTNQETCGMARIKCSCSCSLALIPKLALPSTQMLWDCFRSPRLGLPWPHVFVLCCSRKQPHSPTPLHTPLQCSTLISKCTDMQNK